MPLDVIVAFALVVLGTIIAGAAAGLIYERTTGASAKRAAQLEADLDRTRGDFTQYRQDTARHFGKSAELLGRMATDYRELLDHFVHGAEELCAGNLPEIGVNGLQGRLLDSESSSAPHAASTPTQADSEPLPDELPK